MAEKLDDIKKLSPAERIKRLKEFQEENKKEIEDAQKLIKSSEEEEEIEKELEKIPIPQIRSVDIDALFSPEEKEIFKEKRFVSETAREVQKEKPSPKKESPLESIAEAAPRLAQEQEKVNIDYINQLSQRPAAELKERVAEIYSVVKDTGYLNQDQQKDLHNIDYATRKKLEDIEAGKYTDVTRDVAKEMIMTEKMKNLLQDKYRT
jgi:hypothetical protein